MDIWDAISGVLVGAGFMCLVYNPGVGTALFLAAWALHYLRYR